jgi:hypothetical protein
MKGATKDRVYFGDTFIGFLVWSPDSDFPWAKGTFIPSENFQQFLGYFTEIDDCEGQWLREDLLAQIGITTSMLRLIPENENREEINYLHTLVLFENNLASWRLGDRPLQ